MSETATIEPEPAAEEREAILAALGLPVADDDEGWAATALLESVDEFPPDP